MLTALTGLEGHLDPHSDAAQKRLVAMPRTFDSEVCEHLAYDGLVLHRLGAECTDVRAAEATDQTSAGLDASVAQTVSMPPIPIRFEDLRLDVSAIPLSIWHHVATLLAPEPMLCKCTLQSTNLSVSPSRL